MYYIRYVYIYIYVYKYLQKWGEVLVGSFGGPKTSILGIGLVNLMSRDVKAVRIGEGESQQISLGI